jgi:hypothetical protein
MPASLLIVLALLSGHAAAAQDALPPARDIIDRYVEATGGKGALAKYRSRRAVGQISMPAQGVQGELEILAARPDLMRVRMTIPGVGEILSGYDGKIGWSVNPLTGPMRMDGKSLEQMKADADFDAALHTARRFASLETVEQTVFEGRPAYRIKAVRTTGDEDHEFFDMESGLLLGSIVTRESPMGPVKATQLMSEYREFGGVRVATRIVQRMMGTEQVITINAIEFDTVPAEAFDLPAEIRALSR